jgi:hypothetical protein
MSSDSQSIRGPVPTLVEEFENADWKHVLGLVENRRSETLHLDFVQKHRSDQEGLATEDRQNLSKALSGFANADGGLLVWGVKARKDPGDPVDCCRELIPIGGLTRFLSDLKSAIAEDVSPGVPSARLLAIQSPLVADTGVAIVIIPSSDIAPHMATGKGLHRYYRRISDQFRQMEHYEVADLFGRRPQPKLHAGNFYSVEKRESGFKLIVELVVHNVGRGLIRFPCLTVGHIPEGWSWSADSGSRGPFGQITPPAGSTFRSVGGASDVLYPGDRYSALKMFAFFKRGDGRPDVKIPFEVTADGAVSYSDEVNISWHLLNEMTIVWSAHLKGLIGDTWYCEDHPKLVGER